MGRTRKPVDMQTISKQEQEAENEASSAASFAEYEGSRGAGTMNENVIIPASTPSVIHRPGQQKVLVQNVRAGEILLPRRMMVGGKPIYTKPTRLSPGTTAELSMDEWEQWSKNPVVRAMLDRNLLMVVRRPTELHPQQLMTRTSSPEIPDHLKNDEQERETGAGGVVKAAAHTRGIATIKVG